MATQDIHPITDGLHGKEIRYGNDVDHSLPLGKGEQVLAWASYENTHCAMRTPVIVALDPDELLPW